jgi:hypothetical protein
MNDHGYVFTGMAFLLVVPAIILAASLMNMTRTGDTATAIALRSDVVFYAFRNVQASFERASCSYFLLNGNDTAAIKANLTANWAPYVEENMSLGIGINVSIDESLIDVIYDATSDSIQIGRLNNMSLEIPMNITMLGVTHDLGLKPVRVYTTCSKEPVSVTEPPTPTTILFLHKNQTDFYMDTIDPTGGGKTIESIASGYSQTWTQSPAFTNNFNVTDDILVVLYLKPEPNGTVFPTVTVSLSYGLTSLGSDVGKLVTNESWETFPITGVTGRIIPAGKPIKLRVSVDPNASNPSVEVWFDGKNYNSGVILTGVETNETEDTIPPVFHGIENAINSGTCITPTNCSVELYWSAAADDTTPASDIVYNIYRSTSSGFTPGTPIDSVTAVLTYIDSGLDENTTYYYIVRAQDLAGNEDTNTVERSATPRTGGPYTEYLYSNGSMPSSSDIINATTLYYDGSGTEIVVVDKGDVDIVGFTDPRKNVTDVLSAVVYWIDRNAGTVTKKDRTIEIGNGSVWNWNTTTSNPPVSFTTFSLNVTSHFLNVTSDSLDINDIQMRYISSATSEQQFFYWDQAYVIITYQ